MLPKYFPFVIAALAAVFIGFIQPSYAQGHLGWVNPQPSSRNRNQQRSGHKAGLPYPPANTQYMPPLPKGAAIPAVYASPYQQHINNNAALSYPNANSQYMPPLPKGAAIPGVYGSPYQLHINNNTGLPYPLSHPRTMPQPQRPTDYRSGETDSIEPIITKKYYTDLGASKQVKG